MALGPKAEATIREIECITDQDLPPAVIAEQLKTFLLRETRKTLKECDPYDPNTWELADAYNDVVH